MLQTVWIFSITAVSRTATWLNISHVPRLWPQRMQKGRGIHSSRPFFNVVRLHDDAALFAPELVQCQNHFLKIHCKFHSFFDLQNQQKISRSCHTDRDERLYSRGSTLIDTVLRTMPTLRMQLQSALHQNAASGSHHPRLACTLFRLLFSFYAAYMHHLMFCFNITYYFLPVKIVKNFMNIFSTFLMTSSLNCCILLYIESFPSLC